MNSFNPSNGVDETDPTNEELEVFYKNCQWQGEEAGESWYEQRQVEQDVFLIRKKQQTIFLPPAVTFYRAQHVQFLLRSLDCLPRGYESLSAARPWVMFWIVHSLDLLEVELSEDVKSRVVREVRHCWDSSNGAFGGGRGQTSHMASTYAAVATLCTIGTDEAYNAIDVEALHAYMKKMKQDDGSFRVGFSGEADVRSVYSAVAVASLTGILSRDRALFANCTEYIAGLQGFDGGFGGEWGNETHGGNSYCATASLVALGELESVNTDALLDWAAMRQMNYEGGFQGRTNKLVDSCYSFWVGAIFPLLNFAHQRSPYHPVTADECHSQREGVFDGRSLQRYILECGQNPGGGFRDKPGVAVDLLHTCYSLSGLTVAQEHGGASGKGVSQLKPNDFVYNISVQKAIDARLFFDAKLNVDKEKLELGEK